jgi:dolichol-phosphate mannosyltransferase
MKRRNNSGNLLVIPTFNCAPQICGLIESLAPVADYWDEIWFVDNGSTDETLQRALCHVDIFLSKSKKIKILSNSQNIGLGGTHKTVFEKAIIAQFATLTIFHGDHQAKFYDAIKALEFSKDNPGIFILGSRFLRESRLIGYSKLRSIFNRSMNLYYSILLNRQIHDLGSGLNIFPVWQLKNLDLNKLPNDLTFNIEFLKWLILSKKEISWFPITWVEEDQISNVRVIKQTIKTLKLAILPFGRTGSTISEQFYQTEVNTNAS